MRSFIARVSGLLVLLLLARSSFSVVCSPAPIPPTLNPDEGAVDALYKHLLVDQSGCIKAGDALCAVVSGELSSFQGAVLGAAVTSTNCSANGVYAGVGGAPLSVADKTWYAKRAAFWNSLYLDMSGNAAAILNGTYKFSQAVQAQYLNVAVVSAPAAPSVVGKVSSGTSQLTGKTQAVDTQFPSPAEVYVCVWASQPVGASLDCTSPASPTKPAALEKPDGTDALGHAYMLSKADGSWSAGLSTPLTNGQFVSLVEDITSLGGAVQTITSTPAVSVGPSSQCNKKFATEPYSDCDLSFSLIGGVEQSAQSSLQSETTGFLRVFTRAAISTDSPTNIWASVRLLGAPTASSTEGVVSVVTDPSGTVKTQTFSTIGTSIDYMIGGEYEFYHRKDNPYSASFIAGFGGTTPLQANTLALAYTTPAFGTVECGELFNRFQAQFSQDGIAPGNAANTAGTAPVTPSCLVNLNKPTTTAGGTTYAPVATIGFSNQDRTSFLGKAFIGIRTIDRFLGSGNVACGDSDAANRIGPCERGIVDFTFGQDASITGGVMHKFIFKIDGVHPLPVASVHFLYLFGSMSVRLSRNTNYSPLILQSASVSSLVGTGSSAIPNPSVVVLSLVQPNRDYYRFGAGINLNQVFTKLFSATKTPTP